MLRSGHGPGGPPLSQASSSAMRSALSAPALAPEMWSADTTAMETPEVRYAKSGEVSIAYSVVGDGPFDLVFVSGWVLSALEYAWEGPPADQARLLLAANPVRQAGNGPLRPGHRHPRSRDPDGRHPRGDGRRGIEAGGNHGLLRGGADDAPLRGDLPRANGGGHPLRNGRLLRLG